MKKHLMMIFSLSFTIVAYADQIDMLAEGLSNIVGHTMYIQELRKKIEKAYKEKQFNTAKQLIKEAPREVFNAWEDDFVMQSVLLRVLDYGNYANFSENDKKNCDDIVLLLVDRSDQKDLLVQYSYDSVQASLIAVAIRGEHSFAVVKALMKKQPKLIDPSVFDKDEYNEGNDFFRILSDYYFNMFHSYHVRNKQRIDDFAQYFSQIVNESKIYHFNNEKKFFAQRQSHFFIHFLQGWLNQKQFFDLYVKDWKKYDDIVDPAFVVFESLVARSPDSSRIIIPILLNNYLQFKSTHTNEESSAVRVFLAYVIGELKKLSESENFKFEIRPIYKELQNMGLKTGDYYTLEEILKATELEDLLKK